MSTAATDAAPVLPTADQVWDAARWPHHHLPDDPSTIAFVPTKRRAPGSIKGKERALQDNSYPGVITYRHLYGTGVAGPSNPLRAIAHIDIDAAYAAMEMARLKLDPSVPLAVQQWNGLIAVNYPARAFGITRMESPAEALKKCPHLILRHCQSYRVGDTEPGDWPDAKPATHKISLDYYRRESLKIVKLFQAFCPVVEKASIDESFLDLTLPVRETILSNFPELATLPLGADLDTPLPSPGSLNIVLDWAQVGNVIPVSTVEGEDGGEKPSLSQEEVPVTWSDVGLYYAAEIVKKCRTEVHEKLGYTCSAGIAPNKMIAKLCSGWKKPDAQTILRFAAVGGFLRPLKFRKIRNLGGKLGLAVKDTFEAETVGDLLPFSVTDLQDKLGEDVGIWVWEIVRGLDMSEVEVKLDVKSMISSKARFTRSFKMLLDSLFKQNFRPSISSYGEAVHWLHIFATELYLRLTEARQTTPSVWPKTITLHVRSDGFVIRSHQIPFPFTSHLDIAYIDKFGLRLVRAAVGERDKYEDKTFLGPWTNLSLSFTGLERLEKGQEGLHRFMAGTVMSPSKRPVGAITMKDSPPPTKIAKTEKEIIKPKSVTASPSKPPRPPKPPKPPKLKAPTITFQCARCKNPIPVPVSTKGEDAVKRAKSEHEDYHFARDLLEKERKDEREPARSLLSKPRAAEPASKSKASANRRAGGETSGGQGHGTDGQQSLKGFFTKG